MRIQAVHNGVVHLIGWAGLSRVPVLGIITPRAMMQVLVRQTNAVLADHAKKMRTFKVYIQSSQGYTKTILIENFMKDENHRMTQGLETQNNQAILGNS